MKRLPFLSLLLSLPIVLSQMSGCLYTYQKPLSEEQQAKQFIATDGMSTLYIFRSEGFAEQVQIPIFLNGAPLAQTSARSFLVVDVEPGVQTVVSKTTQEDSLTLVTEPDENYFIWQEVKIGILSPRSKLHQVSAEKGMQQVKRSRLLKGYL